MRSLKLVESVLTQMLKACTRALPLEACGLLGGNDDVARSHYPLRNVADDPARRFLGDPQEQLRALYEMEAAGEELIGIYHSHPNTPPTPSRADIEGALYPRLFYVIVGLQRPHAPEVQAFRLNPERGRAAQAHWYRVKS